MLPTSNSYKFQSLTIERLIREAYELIGITGEFLTVQKMQSAKTSIDLILLEWNNKTVNLWTFKTAFLGLIPYKFKYKLDNTVNQITQGLFRTYTRALGGSPQSNQGESYDGAGGGTASYAFDGKANTACIQTVQNGNISYDYGQNNSRRIFMVGVTSNINATYDLIVEYSPDTANWIELVSFEKQSFTIGSPVWIEVNLIVEARAYRIREKGGATLNVQEIYFTNNISDLQIADLDRQSYFSLANKYTSSRPTSFYLDKQLEPTLVFYPMMTSNLYNCFHYSYTKTIQDSGENYTNTLDIPARFYPTLIWNLALRLLIKYKKELKIAPEDAARIEKSATESWIAADVSDTEINQIISIETNFQNYSIDR